MVYTLGEQVDLYSRKLVTVSSFFNKNSVYESFIRGIRHIVSFKFTSILHPSSNHQKIHTHLQYTITSWYPIPLSYPLNKKKINNSKDTFIHVSIICLLCFLFVFVSVSTLTIFSKASFLETATKHVDASKTNKEEEEKQNKKPLKKNEKLTKHYYHFRLPIKDLNYIEVLG